MTELVVMPEWRACLYQWTIAQDEFADEYGDRLYKNMPAAKVFPLGILDLIGDPTITLGQHWGVLAEFQVTVWGGSDNVAWRMADLVRSLWVARLPGSHSTPAGDFVAGLVEAGGIHPMRSTVATQATEADAETSRARPRCRFDISVPLHPARTSGS